MADRFPLIVNASSRKIEELIAGDNLDLSGNGIAINGSVGNANQYLKSDGFTVSWGDPGDVYLTQTQTVSNKTFENCTMSGSLNIFSSIPNAALVNDTITVNGTTVALGGSVTVPNTDTTYSISALDGGTSSQKIFRLTDSSSNTDDITFEAGTNMSIARSGDVLTFSSSFTDTDTVTTVESAVGGSAVSGQVIIAAAGYASVSQSGNTITITGSNDDTITQIRAGTGQTLNSGNFTLLGGTEVALVQGVDGNGDATITFNSSDTITRVRGGTTGSYTSGDLTIAGGNNVTVSQSGSTYTIDSSDTNTITKFASGSNTLSAGDFKLEAAGATTLSQSTTGGVTTITITSSNDDTGASFTASGGVIKNNVNFELKNNGNFGANTLLKWDSGNSQLANSIITDDGSTCTITGDLVVDGTQTTLNTQTLIVEDNIIELRKGTSLVGSDAGVQVNRTTDASDSVTSFIQLRWDESGGYWKSFDGSVSNRFVTETETQILTNKTLQSPTLTAPVLGAATMTTLNGLEITSCANSVLTISDTKTVDFRRDFIFTSDNNASAVSVNLRLGGDVAYKSDTLGSFSSTTSTQLRGILTDPTGTGGAVFQNTPNILVGLNTTSTSFNLVNSGATTINFGQGATSAINIGISGSNVQMAGNLIVDEDLTVGADVADTITLNGIVNCENADLRIRGNGSNPMIVGRGGGEVAANTAVGYRALLSNNAGQFCTALGYETLFVNDSSYNTALGYQALKINSDGEDNVAVGSNAMTLNEDGNKNVAVGSHALENNTVGNHNVIIGHYAGYQCYGSGNVIIGPAPDENGTNVTHTPLNATGDNQLIIGSGTEAWIRGNSSFDITIPNNTTVGGDLLVQGGLTVDGTVTSVNSNVLTVDDKNLELAAVVNTQFTATATSGSNQITGVTPTAGLIPGMEVTSITDGIDLGAGTVIVSISGNTFTLSASVSGNGTVTVNATGPSDLAASGGGLILKGTTDKTIIYDDSRTDKYWTLSENLEIALGKKFVIGNQLALSATTLGSTVVNSSLESVGTLTGLDVDGAISLGGRVKEKTFFSFGTTLTPTSNTLTINTSGANTICGTTSSTGSPAINDWAFTDCNLSNGQSVTISLILAANTAATYGDGCSVDGNVIPNGVEWSGGSPPIATSNTDILTFIIIKDNSGVTRVFGQGNTDFS